MHTVYLALGSNVGDKQHHIQKAIELLHAHVASITQAPLYETKPVGYQKQDNFLNTAIQGDTDLSPQALLTFVKQIEKYVGRITRFRWGPREVDIDILLYDDRVHHDETLEIPHPRMHMRDFVLRPLADLAPELTHPVFKKPISQLLEEIPKVERSIISSVQE